MRMRKKPNLVPRMERCAEVHIKEPESFCGCWLENFNNFESLYLEIGCGKGKFTAETAESIPKTLLVAIERVPEAMVVGMERVTAKGLKNVRFIDCDAQKLAVLFVPGEVQRIYINFCDPWPHARHAKRRLTSPGFLKLYWDIISPDGEIHFKTDNLPLFEYSLETFAENGWALSEVTRDLHKKGPNGVMTDYETKFYGEGIPINRLVAKRKK